MLLKLRERVGSYTPTRELGRGGSGVVYLANDHAVGRPCAIKVLHAHLASDEIAMERFRREVKAAAAIDHPAIVKSRPIEQLPGDGAWCCVMEYVEAPTLTELCKRSAAPMPLERALRIIAPICEAFDLLHAQDIVHRDLKPDNVLITQRGGHDYPRVLDFGIAKSIRTNEPALTRPGIAPGTVAFMAPEQAKGDPVDRLCDVYALGVMVYWMLTGGRLPYEVPEGLVYFHQLSEPPTDPRQYVSAISDDVANVILTAIHPQRERRPRTMGALALMLAATHADGNEILRACAPQLLIVGNLEETFRSPRARSIPLLSSTPAPPQPALPASPPAPVQPAQLAVPRKYEYGHVLGRGGMAEVVRATMLGQGGFTVPCAVKRILRDYSAMPHFAEMFHQEAHHCSLLEHRNIVRVLDHDVDPDGQWFIAMEFVDGLDLLKLAQSGPIPYAVTIFLICEVLEALDYAHNLPPASPNAPAIELKARGEARGILHRDISLCNVLVSWIGDVKLSDFGIAKIRNATSASGSLVLKGKPAYMAPEQAQGSIKLDGRADLWSIGAVLWELLVGRRLFPQDDLAAALGAVISGEIYAPATADDRIPSDLSAITMRLLTRDLQHRYQTAREVLTDLRNCSAMVMDGRAALRNLLAERFPARAVPVGAAASPTPGLGGAASASHARPAAQTPAAPAELSAQPATVRGPRVGDASVAFNTGESSQPVTAEGPRAFAAPELPPVSWQGQTTTGHANGELARGPRARRRYGLAIVASAATFVAIVLVAYRGSPEVQPSTSFAKHQESPPVAVGSALNATSAKPAPGATSALSPAMTVAPPVTLTVRTSPDGGLVHLQSPRGPVDGRAPLTITVPQGAHVRVRAQLDGYQTVTQDTTVGNAPVSLIVALPAMPAPVSSGKTVERARAPAQPSSVKPSSPPKATEVVPAIIE